MIFSIVLASAFVILLLTRGISVYSDEGPETEENAFESPLLIWRYPLENPASLAEGPSTPGDLLTNGDMDQLGFYWRPPNHWIAGGWFEWFSTKPFNFPEFSDGFERNFYHTYPSAQRLQLWGNDYAGGLMQSVEVTPCVYYQFEAYGQSRPGSDDPPPVEVESHMKVGIEPYGWMSGRAIYDYDPGLEPEEFPYTVTWSPEETHNFAFVPYSVTAEALSSTLTVVLFSSPEVDLEGGVLWNDTIWDTASLVRVPSPSATLLGDGDLPDPDGLITDLRATALPHVAVVEWNTLVDASTQLRYRVRDSPPPITVSEPLSYSLYVPLLTTAIDPSVLGSYSPPDFTPVRHHRVVLAGLPTYYTLDFSALSRRLQGKACVTSASELIRVKSADDGYVLHVPALLKRK